MGEVVDLTVEILKDIRQEIRGLREDQRAMAEEQHAMAGEQVAIREELHGVNGRLDNLIDLSGRAWRGLERRVRRLERHAGF